MFCNNCGKEIPDTAEFCRHCGHKRQPPAKPTLTPTPSKEPSTKEGFPGWTLGLIGIIVVGAIFGGLYFGGVFSTRDRTNAGLGDEPQPAPVEEEDTHEFPQMLHQYLNNPSLVDYSGFDYMEFDWQDWKTTPVITNGIVKIEGTGEWGISGVRISNSDSQPFIEGDAVLLRYKIDSGTEYEIYMATETFEGPDSRRFEVYQYHSTDEIRANFVQGNQEGYDYIHEERFENLEDVDPGQWYYLLFAIADERCLIGIWKAAAMDVSEIDWVYFNLPSDWRDIEWILRVYPRIGNLYLDEYYWFTFDGLN